MSDSPEMAKPFDVAQLFEPQRHRPSKDALYTELEPTFDAMQARRKGMSMYVDSRGTVTAPDSDLADFLDLAAERDLVVTLHAERVPTLAHEDQPVHVFVSRPEELWRIPAFLALWNTAFVDGRWSDAAENQMSYLLGYTGPQRKRWITALRQERPAWTSATTYALLDAGQRKVVDSVGRRCFGPASEIEGLSLIYAAGEDVKPRAFALVPPNHTLARVGLRLKEFRTIFGPFENQASVIRRSVTKKLAPIVNSALESNVQYLTRTGWK